MCIIYLLHCFVQTAMLYYTWSTLTIMINFTNIFAHVTAILPCFVQYIIWIGIFQKNIYFCFIDYAKAFDCVDHKKLWKILKEMGMQDHMTCLLRNLYAGQEATVRTGHGTTDWFQIGKGVCQGCILSPCLFKFYVEYLMRNAGLEET